MKMIVAIIKPSRLDAVLDAVTEAGASGLTVTEVRGYGRQRGKTEVYRGAEYEVKLLPKVKLEIAVPDDIRGALTEPLASTANTARIGNGKVVVRDREPALRTRPGRRDAAAVAGWRRGPPCPPPPPRPPRPTQSEEHTSQLHSLR